MRTCSPAGPSPPSPQVAGIGLQREPAQNSNRNKIKDAHSNKGGMHAAAACAQSHFPQVGVLCCRSVVRRVSVSPHLLSSSRACDAALDPSLSFSLNGDDVPGLLLVLVHGAHGVEVVLSD